MSIKETVEVTIPTPFGVDVQTLIDYYNYVHEEGEDDGIFHSICDFLNYRQQLDYQQVIENIMDILPPEGTSAINPHATLEDVRKILTGE